MLATASSSPGAETAAEADRNGGIGWLDIVRLGLVQTALGAIVVLTTSTLNRVMVVELALPAMLPGLLVGLHYAVQMSRPRWGHGSDVGGRRTPWIAGGMVVLAAGGLLAAVATMLMATALTAGTALAVLAFVLIGAGVGAAGTSLLVLLAKLVAPGRRAAAATIVWVMMIVGFIITAATAGHFLDPFSTARLVAVTACVCAAALAVTGLAIWGVEARASARRAEAQADAPAAATPTARGEKTDFRTALAQVWDEPQARRFTLFVFISMFAYSAQDLILEPYAGSVFGFTPGESTKLAGVQHSGVLLGMILVAVLATGWRGWRLGSLKQWTVAGCLMSAAALIAIAVAGRTGPEWPLRETVFALGLANGMFAVAAIGSMMALVSQGREGRDGLRMGLWGAAQAIAFGLGSFSGAVGADVIRALSGSALTGYAGVFLIEATMFLVAAQLAIRVGDVRRTDTGARQQPNLSAVGENLLAETQGAR